MSSLDNPENEALRRRVQQKFMDRFTQNNDEAVEKHNDKDVKSKKSPYSIENFVWLFGAAMVFYFSDFTSVVLYDMRIKSSWFWVGITSFIFHLSIASFLVFWLSFWNKINSNKWESLYPKAVPMATASFIIGFICLTVALWPVWGFLSPVILGALFMGVVVVIAMIG